MQIAFRTVFIFAIFLVPRSVQWLPAGQGLKLNLNSNRIRTTLVTVFIQPKVLYEYVFKDKYSIHERIGKGAYATVHRCRRKSDDKDFAVKNIDIRLAKTRTIPTDYTRGESSWHLVHPNIVKLEETYWTRSDGSVPLSPSEYDHLLIVWSMRLEKNYLMRFWRKRK